MNSRVFISYSGEDLKDAEAIRDALEAKGLDCWMAPRDIPGGEKWYAAIHAAIQECRVLVLVFSDRSNRSQQVEREICLAVDRRRYIIPYRIEAVPPAPGLEYFICVTHWLDAWSTGPMDPQNLESLFDAVNRGLSAGADSSIPGTSLPDEPVRNEDAIRELRTQLVDKMIAEHSTVVSVVNLWQQNETEFHAMLHSGELQRLPSFVHPENGFVVFGDPADCERAVAQWMEHQASLTAEDVIHSCRRFQQLAGGVARFIAEDDPNNEAPLLREIIRFDESCVEAIVAHLISRLGGIPFRKPAREELQDCSNPQPSALKLVARLVLQGDGFAALRGLARGVQRLFEEEKAEQASPLFDAIRRWDPGRPLAKSERLFLLEVANELGRTWLSQGETAKARQLFGETLDDARRLNEARLVGVLTNNLALAAPDQPSPSELSEVIVLLRENIDRFKSISAGADLGTAHHHLGNAYKLQENFDAAEEHYREDLKICRTINDVGGLTDSLDCLGLFLAEQKQYKESERLLEEEVACFDKLFDLPREARALANLGRCQLGLGHAAKDHQQLLTARGTLEQSLKRYSSLDKPQEQAATLENLGRACYLLQDKDLGIHYLRESAELYVKCPKDQDRSVDILRELEQLV